MALILGITEDGLVVGATTFQTADQMNDLEAQEIVERASNKIVDQVAILNDDQVARRFFTTGATIQL